ncbi:hypothetical protein L249_1131 [Ophiocordyceps polyrhachis-furcata BCC 54312]|uniref:Uncharacterized protein n=1 Tax=Ophiocordyceps polyrhachis-furcata BCC 54312 TaxID=1330021 RepID=A0A367LFD6_9HYPO|nr:hypothetical protein L249_1131 [Ophiocordyceps polyrhachis-furcata BCC 54312]
MPTSSNPARPSSQRIRYGRGGAGNIISSSSSSSSCSPLPPPPPPPPPRRPPPTPCPPVFYTSVGGAGYIYIVDYFPVDSAVFIAAASSAGGSVLRSRRRGKYLRGGAYQDVRLVCHLVLGPEEEKGKGGKHQPRTIMTGTETQTSMTTTSTVFYPLSILYTSGLPSYTVPDITP